MKVQLRDYARLPANTRDPEIAVVDFVMRIAVTPDGHWIPFENIAGGSPHPTTLGCLNAQKFAAEIVDCTFTGEAKPIEMGDTERAPPLSCPKCLKTFQSAMAKAGHKRHCK